MTYKIGDIIRDSKGLILIKHIREVKVKDYTEKMYTGTVLLKNGLPSLGYKKHRSIYEENILKS